ncbi:MAG: hypothetical protein WD690_20875 [Vicinamibacterales bacterium]
MTRRRTLLTAGLILFALAVGLVIRNQIKVHRGRQTRHAAMLLRHPVIPVPANVAQFRRTLFEMLQPVALSNCELQRFGERNDGGYLMCANLLGAVQAGYSYGINGYDKWGCDISKAAGAAVHQYDCFNTDRPSCWRGQTIFHEECVGPRTETLEGRLFDSVQNQFAKNGDGAKRIVMKIDVEGAEWDTFLSMPDATFAQIDQVSVEFHWEEGSEFGWVLDERYPRAVGRLKQFFEIAHIHFNNASCVADLAPFPSFAYEVLFVSKRLAVVDPGRQATGLHPQDSRNNASLPDCQAGGG